MAYCERLAELRLVTNIQLLSLRMAIDVGNELVAMVAGVCAVKLPVVVLILYADMAFCP